MKKLSAVIACYRDAPAIAEMYARLSETFRSIGVDYEIIFVNDASPDNARELLAELADEGVTHAAMEASSHGLDQFRLDGVRLAAAAFTNLGRDHMDYHPTVEDYMAAKMRLFRDLLPKGSPAVIFADDAWSPQAISAARDAGLARYYTGGLRGGWC